MTFSTHTHTHILHLARCAFKIIAQTKRPLNTTRIKTSCTTTTGSFSHASRVYPIMPIAGRKGRIIVTLIASPNAEYNTSHLCRQSDVGPTGVPSFYFPEHLHQHSLHYNLCLHTCNLFPCDHNEAAPTRAPSTETHASTAFQRYLSSSFGRSQRPFKLQSQW